MITSVACSCILTVCLVSSYVWKLCLSSHETQSDFLILLKKSITIAWCCHHNVSCWWHHHAISQNVLHFGQKVQFQLEHLLLMVSECFEAKYLPDIWTICVFVSPQGNGQTWNNHTVTSGHTNCKCAAGNVVPNATHATLYGPGLNWWAVTNLFFEKNFIYLICAL